MLFPLFWMLFYPLIDLLTPALPSDLNQELASLGSLLYPSEMVRFQYCRTATIPVLQHSSIVLLALDSYLCNSIYRQLFLYGSLWPNWDLTFVCMIIWFLSVLVHSATITKYHILFFFFFFLINNKHVLLTVVKPGSPRSDCQDNQAVKQMRKDPL